MSHPEGDQTGRLWRRGGQDYRWQLRKDEGAMRPWIDWLARVGVAGAWIMAAGCGGGDVPDPGSDSTAASDAAPEAGSAPQPAPAPAPGPAGPAMRGRPGMMANRNGQAPPAANDAGEGDTAAQPPAGENPPAAKAEGGSATAEMLALATGGQNGQGAPGSSAGSGGDAASGQAPPPGGPGGGAMQGQGRPGGPPPGYPGAGGSGGGMAGMPGGAGRSGGPGQPGGPPGAPQSGGPPQSGAPGSSGGAYADQMAMMMQQRQNRGGGTTGGGYPGSPGGPPTANQGGPGGPGRMGYGGPGQQDNGPTDTRSPDGAVRAFLKALRDKDRDRLAEATALRSQTEASTEKKKELFAKVVDMSISDSELDDLAKRLDGYQVAGENAPTSTGKLGIIIRKSNENGDFLSRTVTVRKERKGWGVMDLSDPHLFKSMQMRATRRKTSGGG